MASPTASSSSSNTKEVAMEIPTFLRVYKDGTIDRLQNTPIVPPSISDLKTGVSSKDIVLSDNPFISARLYLPKSAELNEKQKVPILVYFHGGGFYFESAFSQFHQNYFNSFVSRTNVLVVSVEYRLAPEHPLPIAFDDCWTALKWVASHFITTPNIQNSGINLIQSGDDKRDINDNNCGLYYVSQSHNYCLCLSSESSNKESCLVNHGDFCGNFEGTGSGTGATIAHNIATQTKNSCMDRIPKPDSVADTENDKDQCDSGSYRQYVYLSAKFTDVEPWLVKHGDSSRIFIGGDSAGGPIAHNMALRLGDEDLPGGIKVQGAFVSHPYFIGSKPVGSEPEIGLEQSVPALTWKFVYPTAPGGLDNPLINPLAPAAPSLTRLGCSKLLVCVAGDDFVCRPRGVLYYEAVKNSGWQGEVDLFEVEGEDHVFHMQSPESENGKKMIQRFADFLRN